MWSLGNPSSLDGGEACVVQHEKGRGLTAPALFKVGEGVKVTNHIGYIYGFKLEPFSPPSFCQSGAGLEQYTYYYQKGYRQLAGKPYYYCYESQQKTSLQMAA